MVCSVSEVGDRTGERVLSPAPPAVVGGLVTSPSNVELWAPAIEESVAAKHKQTIKFCKLTFHGRRVRKFKKVQTKNS